MRYDNQAVNILHGIALFLSNRKMDINPIMSTVSSPYSLLFSQCTFVKPLVTTPTATVETALAVTPITPALPANRTGVTILAFSSYPNGFPVLDLDEKAAKKMAQKALPSVPIEERRLLFGRTKWQGRTVGAVVYPMSEQDVRHVQNILANTQLSDYERNTKVNNFMPTVMAKDAGQTRIFDLQRDKLLTPEEAQELAKVGHVVLNHANRQAEQITSTAGALDTPAAYEKEKSTETPKHLPKNRFLAEQSAAGQAHYQQSYKRFSPYAAHALTTKHPTLSMGTPLSLLSPPSVTQSITAGVQQATVPTVVHPYGVASSYPLVPVATLPFIPTMPVPQASFQPEPPPLLGHSFYQPLHTVAETPVPPSANVQAFYRGVNR